jgi:hypothetical protein
LERSAVPAVQQTVDEIRRRLQSVVGLVAAVALEDVKIELDVTEDTNVVHHVARRRSKRREDIAKAVGQCEPRVYPRPANSVTSAALDDGFEVLAQHVHIWVTVDDGLGGSNRAANRHGAGTAKPPVKA